MECVSISSNDTLQLGVLLLSYMELLNDSVKKDTMLVDSGRVWQLQKLTQKMYFK